MREVPGELRATVAHLLHLAVATPGSDADSGRGGVAADEIRILAGDSPFALQSLNQFDVRMAGLPGLTIEGIRYGPN